MQICGDRAIFLAAYLRQRLEMLLDAYIRRMVFS